MMDLIGGKRVLKKTRVITSRWDVITSKRPIDQFQSNRDFAWAYYKVVVYLGSSIDPRGKVDSRANVHLMNTHATHPNLQDWPW